MRLPVRGLAGHLCFARDGSVWAVYRIDPVCYPHLSQTDKLAFHRRLRSALVALPTQSMLLGIARRVDPGEVVQAMIAGVDLEACPAWRGEAGDTLDELLDAELIERRHYLAARLPDDGLAGAWASWQAAAAGLAERFTGGPPPVRRRDVTARLAQAERLEARLARSLTLHRVSSGELRWLYARAVRRGLDEPFLDDSWAWSERWTGDGDDARLSGPALAPLADAVFFEGGARDDRDRPAHRRYLRVDTAAGSAYQALLAVADMPREWLFPDGGGEWFRQLDAVPFPVDWCARVAAVANRDAQEQTKKRRRELEGQVDQYAEAAGPPADLADALADMDEERAELSANKNEPELQASLLFACWADEPGELERRVELVQSMFAGAEYGLARPTGGQLALFRAMLPGSATPPPARDYTQYLLPRDLAAGLPFAGHDVGDPQGMLLGISLDGAGATPVLFDPAYGPAHGRSGSVGIAGNLGSGKSYTVKRIAHATLARGGRVVAMDRTQRGEYAAFATVAPSRAQVVRLAADSPVSLDPLQLFAGDERVTYATGFLALLTRTVPTELDGIALAEAVQAAADDPDATLADVLSQLEARAAEDHEADTVARKLRALTRTQLAGLAFDADRDTVDLDADYLVFHMPGLSLPSREELLNEHLARQLLPEQILSQALLYLVAAVMRAAAFAEWQRFGALALDEVWALTASMQGRQLITDAIRDGRKHHAAVWLLSQHADDLGDDQLTHLLGTRLVFRQDPGAVESACRFLGVADASDTAARLTEAAPGQCLLRDSAGRVGHIQVLAARDELHAAFDTTPGADQPPDQPVDHGDAHDQRTVTPARGSGPVATDGAAATTPPTAAANPPAAAEPAASVGEEAAGPPADGPATDQPDRPDGDDTGGSVWLG